MDYEDFKVKYDQYVKTGRRIIIRSGSDLSYVNRDEETPLTASGCSSWFKASMEGLSPTHVSLEFTNGGPSKQVPLNRIVEFVSEPSPYDRDGQLIVVFDDKTGPYDSDD